MTISLKTLALASTLALATTFSATSPSMAVGASITQKFVIATHNYVTIDSIKIAYRKAGNPANPTILLLHGFPTSSHMFRNIIPKLAEKYHVIAPDYPGFGASEMPPADKFEYSFAKIAKMMTSVLDHEKVGKYFVYLMDYGAPVGYRMFASNPQRVSGFIIQNGNAYEEGLKEF